VSRLGSCRRLRRRLLLRGSDDLNVGVLVRLLVAAVALIALALPDGARAQSAVVRARMAPDFAVTTIDGRHVSLDQFQGKVVLLDFWATWCGPCIQALPHMKQIAQDFADEPLVILSVSLDSDANDGKWRTFVARNQMTWLQARDGGFTGPVARLFGVTAIPHTFTIDANGDLRDEQIGDAAIETKLRKLCAEARRMREGSRSEIALGR